MKFVRHAARDGMLRPRLLLSLIRMGEQGLAIPGSKIWNVLDPYARTFDAVLRAMGQCLDSISEVFTAPIDDEGQLKANARGFPDAIYRLHLAYLTHIEILEKLAVELASRAESSEAAGLKKTFARLSEPISRRANQPKHSGSHYVFALKYEGARRVPGYAVFGTFPNGTVGPDLRAHPKATAVSVLREMRTMLLAMYFLSDVVLDLGVGELPDSGGPSNEPTTADEALITVVERLQMLPSLVFASEAGLALPLAAIQHKDGTAKLVLRNMLTMTPGTTFGWPSLIQVQAYGFTKTFKYGIFGDNDTSIANFRASIMMRGLPRDEIVFA